jgi:hypothetical protein
MFDPNQHAMDMTYLDGNLKIVRLTGHNKFEGIRDIFMCGGGIQIYPTNGQLCHKRQEFTNASHCELKGQGIIQGISYLTNAQVERFF